MTVGVIIALILWLIAGIIIGIMLFLLALRACLDPDTLLEVIRQLQRKSNDL